MELLARFFDELSATETYEILKSRSQIFHLEQNIHYLDEDDVDYKSLHCFFMEEGRVVAYLRAFYENDDHDIVRIGRVLTLEHGKGLGKELISMAITAIKERMGAKKIVMDAQKHAIGFYEKLGFKITSDEFLEEGIIHVVMEKEV